VSVPDTADADALDRRLVARARSGDADAFDELVSAHGPALYRLLVRLLGNPADAEDVAQEALVKAWRGLSGFRGDARFSTWLHRIAVNEANRRLARDARRSALPLDDAALETPDASEGPAALAEASELAGLFESWLADLPGAYRAAVVLRDVEGLTNEEAAAALGIEVRNFKSRLHRGRMAIRVRLEDFLRAT